MEGIPDDETPSAMLDATFKQQELLPDLLPDETPSATLEATFKRDHKTFTDLYELKPSGHKSVVSATSKRGGLQPSQPSGSSGRGQELPTQLSCASASSCSEEPSSFMASTSTASRGPLVDALVRMADALS